MVGLDIPAKAGRVVMFENYLKDGRTVDVNVVHSGYSEHSDRAKRLILAGIYYDGPNFDMTSRSTIPGSFMYFSERASAPALYPHFVTKGDTLYTCRNEACTPW